MQIQALDLGFQGVDQAIASYLVEGPEGPVLVETGPGSTLPNLVAELGKRGHGVEDVRDVLVTHIHLDHAGAAGWWAQQGARVHVHHIGLRNRFAEGAGQRQGQRPGPAKLHAVTMDGDTVRAVRDANGRRMRTAAVPVGGVDGDLVTETRHRPGHAEAGFDRATAGRRKVLNNV